MKRFLQLHLLTSYPPANLNRDDLGRPKTAVIGGTTRLRISSQSLKRAWRTSDIFQEKFGQITPDGTSGIRTKQYGEVIYATLLDGGIGEKKALEWARSLAGCFGKIKKDKEPFPNNLHIEQLAFISPEEQHSVHELITHLIATNTDPSDEQLDLLRMQNSAADLALFGRMLAKNPSYNIEAAIQVGHAFSVQKISVEDDFFTAVDDLNTKEDDVGAGHMGDIEFASGIFYTYINIDRELLLKNLSGCDNSKNDIWTRAIQAIVESAAKVSPTGKQNSFGSRAYSHYVLAELGNQQPRSLALAYVNDIRGNMLEESILKIEETRDKMTAVYGACSEKSYVLNILENKGTFQQLLSFCVEE